MIGVIVVPGHSEKMHHLDAKRSLALLPLGDRPILQHVVEGLVAQGVTSIELIVGHAPEKVEALLGNGDRWGCRFRYHLATQPDRPYRSLKIISELRTEPWTLVHAERYPCINLPVGLSEKPVLFYGISRDHSTDGNHSTESAERWKGTAVFPPGAVTDVFANLSTDELHTHLEDLVRTSAATAVKVPTWLDASSPSHLLETQTLLLQRKLNGMVISGTEREPGIWISRNVVIHPSAELVAPIYVGPNSRLNRGVKLGPNAVIEGECIVDTNTTIESTLITSGSYVGEGLELNDVVVDHNLLINVRLGTSVDIVESFLLGGLNRPRRPNWIARGLQSILAVLLIILFFPVSVLSLLVFGLLRRLSYTKVQMVQLPARENELTSRSYPLPCLGADAWIVPRVAGWRTFLRQFLPGLFAVAQGRISFVGLPPRTPEEIGKLSSDWRALYLQGVSGLITEAALAIADPGDETQKYLADAYYVVRQSFLHNLKLTAQYFLRLLLPVKSNLR
jgi:NDP-sugar pyrophosphorylase family protein